MSGRPLRKGPKPESRFPYEAVADNIRDYRMLRRLDQKDVAERMTNLGHRWYPSTVGEVERHNRTVSVDELFSLALVLDLSVRALLDPYGADGGRRQDVDIGLPETLTPDLVNSLTLWSGDDGYLRVSWEGNRPVKWAKKP